MEYPSGEMIRAIADSARDYMISNYGHLTGPREPRRDPSGVWHVQIVCSTKYGNLVIGQMILDDSGAILEKPSPEELDRAIDYLITKLESVQLPEGRELTVRDKKKNLPRTARSPQPAKLVTAKAS